MRRRWRQCAAIAARPPWNTWLQGRRHFARWWWSARASKWSLVVECDGGDCGGDEQGRARF
jgi:hypothetical protein